MANSKSKTKKKKVVRRGKNEGSVYQRNDGRWCAVVSLGYDNDGKRVRKIFYGWTRSEVAMKMTAALGEKLNGGHASVINDDLRTLIHDWLVTFKQANVSPPHFRNRGNACKAPRLPSHWRTQTRAGHSEHHSGRVEQNVGRGILAGVCA